MGGHGYDVDEVLVIKESEVRKKLELFCPWR